VKLDMARYTDASCRLCRREGQKLFLKGSRCYTDKCAFTRREQAPGQHGAKKKKLSDYGIQLREKQKAKVFYGVLESQFRKYFEMASTQKGKTGENLLKILETRLDNVVYRMGLGTSRAEARQIVRHGHILVNGKKVNIPSYLLSKNDVITLAEASVNSDKIKANMEQTAGRVVPSWIEFNAEQKKATIVEMPKREEVDLTVQEHLIVELYSK
jgi:small subunit ribosomal protein S4